MKYIWDGTEFVPKERIDHGLHHVQGDIEEFRSTDGALISGRRQWREHLKATGNIEMGQEDVKRQYERWQSKRSTFQDRIRQPERSGVSQSNTDVVRAPDLQASQIQKEVANRLDGRPTPDRKMLIKLTLETARMLRGR